MHSNLNRMHIVIEFITRSRQNQTNNQHTHSRNTFPYIFHSTNKCNENPQPARHITLTTVCIGAATQSHVVCPSCVSKIRKTHIPGFRLPIPPCRDREVYVDGMHRLAMRALSENALALLGSMLALGK